ncbi:MAG: hypothetical protein US81_C0008G0008 [Parcubacteria group bacterium GW2011_GWE2_38_18]|nr:MAG: hypothetical protein US81_C0008G0008 [Parcubacteria group bacterium GW2011_GWE2_38_18]
MIRSKSSFILGLASGVAVVSLIGFLVFLGIFMRKELGITGNTDGQVAEVVDNTNDDEPSDPAPAKPDSGKPVTVQVAKDDHIRGNKNAKITIVEWSDIQCPFCTRFHDTMKQVMKTYPTQVRWVFKHFPLESIHPYAQKAAEASECAGKQNKFWEYLDVAYANQDKLNTDYITTIAKDLKLDMGKFSACLSSGEMASKVKKDAEYGQTLGVQGTPGSFINGINIPGAVPFSQVDEMIKAELAK